MPHFRFPADAKGWVTTVIAATVGLVGGGLALNLMGYLVERARGE